jgi:hypothetical protein
MAEERRNSIQWQLTGPAGVVRSGQDYGLKNNEYGQSIVYGERDTGVNLIWDPKNTGANITLVRASGVKDVIRHGDFIAIHVKGGKYLRYQKRTVAVNLAWSDTPLEEWQIIGAKAGEPVMVGQPFSLKNKVEDDVLVYAVREFGINLRWDKDYQLKGDRSLGDAVLEVGIAEAMKLAEASGVPPMVTGAVRGLVGV